MQAVFGSSDTRSDAAICPACNAAAAIAADPDYGKAYVSLGGNGTALAINTLSGAALRARLDASEQAARHALALMPGSGEPYAVLGPIFQGRLDLRRAKDSYDTAYRALPGNSTVLRTKANFDALMGDSNAVALFQGAMTLDPLRAANARVRRISFITSVASTSRSSSRERALPRFLTTRSCKR